MKDLIQFNWKAFNTVSGAKLAIGVVVLMLTEGLTGESWMITALVAVFAWLCNSPGPLKDRVGGMVAFTLGAILCTLLVYMIGPQKVHGIVALSVIGLLGTVAALWSTRAGMIGWAIIMYMIYAPSFVAGIGLEHTIFAILIGVGVLFILNVAEAVFIPSPDDDAPIADPGVGASTRYVAAYALIIAIVFAVASVMGQSIKTDPTMAAATAFFVIGFDARKTWIGGIARLIGVGLGIEVATTLLNLIGPGLALSVTLVITAFLCFAMAGVHPSFLMFFLTIYFGAGWIGMQPEVLELTTSEKMAGETLGVVIGMIAVGLLQFWDKRLTKA